MTAPVGNLSQLAPIAGSEELLLARGRAVHRLDVRSGRATPVARAREGFRLRGAAVHEGRFVLWTSRRWASVNGGCRPVPDPRPLVVD